MTEKPNVSLYDMIKSDTDEAVTPPLTVQHPAPGMEEWTLTFLPDIDYDTQYKVWVAQATSKVGKREVNNSFLNQRVLAETCLHFSKNGVVAMGESGPINFHDEKLISMYGGRAVEAVKGFLVADGYVNAIAALIIEKAGYGAEVEIAAGITPKA